MTVAKALVLPAPATAHAAGQGGESHDAHGLGGRGGVRLDLFIRPDVQTGGAQDPVDEARHPPSYRMESAYEGAVPAVNVAAHTAPNPTWWRGTGCR